MTMLPSKTKIRVISDTVTFYPLDGKGEEMQARTDDMTLRVTLTYLKAQMGEDFQFFTAGDLFVVIQQWRGMLFMIETADNPNPEILRIQLQTAREILIFLFGLNFEAVMSRNISLTKRQIFAKYLDAYLSECDEDYLTTLNALRIRTDTKEVSKQFLSAMKEVHIPQELNFITAVLFYNHDIVARFNGDSDVELEPETYSLMQIFLSVEYDLTQDQEESLLFDEQFILSEDNETLKHRNAYLRIERNPTACSLSTTRCGENSPFILLVASQNSKPSMEVRSSLSNLLQQIVCKLPQPTLIPPTFVFSGGLDDPIHFVVIDRTRGDVWELPIDESARRLNLPYEIGLQQIRRLTKKMAALAMSAVDRGCTTMMRGEMDFQFCYQMLFDNNKGERLQPHHVYKSAGFNDDNGLNYRTIVDTVFRPGDEVNCYELMSIYRGKIHVKTAIANNEKIFMTYKRMH